MDDREEQENRSDRRRQITYLLIKTGYRSFRAGASLEDQRLHKQEKWDSAQKEQYGLQQGMTLSIVNIAWTDQPNRRLTISLYLPWMSI